MDVSWRNQDDKRQHDWLYVAVLLSTILLYTVTVGFNVLPGGSSLIPNDIGQLSYSIYDIDITPAGWVFATIWSLIFFFQVNYFYNHASHSKSKIVDGLIFIFQFIWLIYNFICIFRTTNDEILLYRKVNFLPMGSLIAFMINNIMVITWIFLYTNKYAAVSYSLFSLFLVRFGSLQIFPFHIFSGH